MSSSIRLLRAKIRWNHRYVMRGILALGVAGFLWSGSAQVAVAVRNNTNNIPDNRLQALRNASQNVKWDHVNNYGGPTGKVKSPPCRWRGKEPVYHFQMPWLSQAGKPTANERITIEEGVNSVNVQYNRAAGYCHYIFTSVLPLSKSKIVDPTDLRITGTKVDEISAAVGGTSLSISGLRAGDELERMDYGFARSNSLRFVKDGDQPYRNQFSLSGLKDLKPGNYTIKLTIYARLVNRFGDNFYLCVSGAKKTNATDWSKDERDNQFGCPRSLSTLTIQLTVNKKYNGTCKVTNVPSALVSGQKFSPTFTITNTGTKDWPVVKPESTANYFKLRPVSGNPWGKNPVFIEGSGVKNGVLPAQKQTKFSAEFTVPDPVPPNFSWRVVHDGAGGGLGTIANCPSSPINSRLNRPFLRVSGGDVISGASFTTNDAAEGEDEQASTYVYGGYDATIDANGANSTLGSSSGQYGVFASGLVDDIGGSFYGNDLYMRGGATKDLLFANTEGTEAYGRFYGGEENVSLPNVNITKLINVAKRGGEYSDNTTFKKHVSNRRDTPNPADKGGSGYFKNNGTGYSISNGSFQSVEGSKVIVVEGDVTIGQDLKYSPGEQNNMILIVLGNIYVRSNVRVLDGTYIAFPTSEASGSDGIFDTCSNIDPGKIPTELTTDDCNNKLTINGRLIARDVIWKRTFGTIGGSVIAGSCVYSSGNYDGCAAEFINFSPATYFNSPLEPTEDHENTGPSNIPHSVLDLPSVY